MALDLSAHLGDPKDPSVVSSMAAGLTGSEILKIAGEIRALEARGEKPCNLTVGDFRPSEFPIPKRLGELVGEALAQGHTNYPPSDGMPELRKAVQRLYEERLGLKYPLESIVVASGARPILYGAYRSVLEAGEKVVYPLPSWNNNHYAHLMGAAPVEVETSADDGFMPTAERLAPHLANARLLVLCSPGNPTGTMLTRPQLERLCALLLDENRRREQEVRKPLVLLFDQIYWAITHGTKHVTPLEVAPELARWTVFVDGISKSLAATGLRVGWGVGPASIISRMRDVLGHVGAWAPKPEQVATARFLEEDGALDEALADLQRRAFERLSLLHEGFRGMAERGLPVRSIEPQGAIYLSVNFGLGGRLKTTEDVRRLLLEEAGFAVVPFRAFGFRNDQGWCRLSVGAVSPQAIRDALPRVESALRSALG